MKALVFVRTGDDVALPHEMMEAAGIEEGDAVTFAVTGLGSVEVRVMPLPPPEEVLGWVATDEADNGPPSSDADEEAVSRARDDQPVRTLD